MKRKKISGSEEERKEEKNEGKRNKENAEKELVKAQGATSLEEVSTDAAVSGAPFYHEVFTETRETNPTDPGSRLRLISRKLVLEMERLSLDHLRTLMKRQNNLMASLRRMKLKMKSKLKEKKLIKTIQMVLICF